ncbi:MAG: sorbosone dehydrogenase family protein [Fimbriimonas sp.]|nr:sorbosone dehydrogenase family protein [Fimbriimonas sp.]
MSQPSLFLISLAATACLHIALAGPRPDEPQTGHVLTGNAAMGDWTTDAPGVRRRITAGDLPKPYATRSIDNGPSIVRRPDGAWPKVPNGFRVTEYITGLNNPREIVTAPNGDLFIAESEPGRIRVLRGLTADGKPAVNHVFASRLRQPFGIAFYPAGPRPKWLYIANTDSVVRFPYRNGDLQAAGSEETVVAELPGGGRLRGGGHWTRDIRFSADGRKMYVSVGSLTNDHEDPRARDERRADILEYDPDGKHERIYASGIRNAVGLAIHPKTGELWCSVNERDGLGDNLVPDYITRVKEGGFYGWPWFYIGSNYDPRHVGERPDLKDKVLVPEVLVGSHYASLCMTFYTGSSFPREYRFEGFASEHGSWNRARRVGYKVIRVVARNGAPTGEFEDFMTGFVTPDGDVWGRPVGVTVAQDGALMVTDDASGTVWRVQYGK